MPILSNKSHLLKFERILHDHGFSDNSNKMYKKHYLDSCIIKHAKAIAKENSFTHPIFIPTSSSSSDDMAPSGTPNQPIPDYWARQTRPHPLQSLLILPKTILAPKHLFPH